MDKLDMSLDDIAPPSNSGGGGRGGGRGRGRGRGRGGPVRRSGGSYRNDATPYSRKTKPSGGNNTRVEKRGQGGGRRGDTGTSVYVGNLSFDTSWQTLKDHMRECGEVTRADIMEGGDGRSKGCGLVTFANARDATRAINELTDSELDGRPIFVREDREQPNSGGGGNNARAEKRGQGGGGGRRGGGDGGTSVYVGNLSFDTSWQDLKDHMRECGEVVHADVMENADGRSKGCGLVTFASAQDASRAINELTDSELDGRPIFVREDREQGGNDRGKGGNRNDRSNNDRGNVRVEKRGQGGNDRGNDDRGGEVALYVGNIPWDLSWQDLKDAFEEYNCAFSDVGEIRDGRGRGYGIVKIPNMSTAKRAIKEMDQAIINGREIYVRFDEQ